MSNTIRSSAYNWIRPSLWSKLFEHAPTNTALLKDSNSNSKRKL